jgi:hypothetical protein
VFIPVKLFQPSLMFLGKATAGKASQGLTYYENP